MDTGTLLLELGTVILALAALGRVAARFGLPPIPLYLLAGLALGEGGIIELRASSEFVEASAEIGVILLLLMLGLEYSPDELLASTRQNLPAGVLDAVLNAAPGALLGLLLGLDPLGCLTLAGVTYISSSGIVAKVLTDLGRIGNRETPVILSLLVLEDLAMAFYLPLLTATVAGLSLLGTTLSVSLAVGVVVLVLTATMRYGEHLSSLVFSHNDEQLLLRVLGLTLVVAGLANLVQVSAGVGAFMVGLALSGQAAENARGLLSPLRDFFAAAFFLTFGLHVHPSEVLSNLQPALLLVAVTGATKIVTGWWAAKRAGIGRPGRARAGMALIPRGEFSIVIAGLALAGGVDRIGPLATAYVLLTAVVGPFLARHAEYLLRVRTRPAGTT